MKKVVVFVYIIVFILGWYSVTNFIHNRSIEKQLIDYIEHINEYSKTIASMLLYLEVEPNKDISTELITSFNETISYLNNMESTINYGFTKNQIQYLEQIKNILENGNVLDQSLHSVLIEERNNNDILYRRYVYDIFNALYQSTLVSKDSKKIDRTLSKKEITIRITTILNTDPFDWFTSQ